MDEELIVPAVFYYPYTVVPADIDGLGHANNLAYLRWAQDAAVAHSAAQGWPTHKYHEQAAGWVVRTHEIEYLKPAFAGDSIVVCTWVANMKKVTSLRRYRIVRPADRAVLAVAATDWAYIHYTTGLPRRVPPEVAGAFELIADGTEIPFPDAV